MKKLYQTRLHNPPESIGNCFATVIACLLDKDSSESVIQIQEHFSDSSWERLLKDWLIDRGLELVDIDGHLFDDNFYIVTGLTTRNYHHACIYQNGTLYHDPLPEGGGLCLEKKFKIIKNIYKVCFKCNNEKHLSDFYTHKQMKDRHLNKCKKCTAQDTKAVYYTKTSDLEGLEKERQRHREKYHRLGYKYKEKNWNKEKPWKKSPILKGLRSHSMFKGLSKDFELHHWNYNDDYLKDVIILSRKHHKALHQHMFLDIEKRIYRTKEGVYLDNRLVHEEYIISLGLEIHKI